MYFQYGTYTHLPNTVTLSSVYRRSFYSSRNFRINTVIGMNISGELIANGSTALARQQDLTDQLIDLETAYSVNNQDAGFFDDNGDPTAHMLLSSHPLNLSGVMIDYLEYRDDDGASRVMGSPSSGMEYAAKRTFAIGMNAIYDTGETGITDYQDSIERFGTGGSEYSWVRLPSGLSVPRRDFLYSPVIYVHNGYAEALDAYPSPPAPLASGANYIEQSTRIKNITGKRYRNGYVGYRTTWSYTYKFNAINPSIAPVLI